MACHEIAALRLGLMQIIGIKDDALFQHELAELGTAAESEGPLRHLMQAKDLESLQEAYDHCLTDLETRLSQMASDDPQRAYYQTLVVLNKKVEGELRNFRQGMAHFFNDLEEVHDHMHAIYPVEA